jgi:hypothetical protein
MTAGGPIKTSWFVVQVIWYLGWGAAAMSVAMFLAVSLTDFQIKYVHLPIEVSLIDPIPDGLITPGSLPVVGYEGWVRVAAENIQSQALWLLIPMLLITGYLWIVYLMRGLLGSLRRGSPFIPENPKRLKTIGYLVAFGGPFFGLLNHIYGRVHVYQLKIPNAELNVPVDIYPFAIFLGLVILLIGQIFAYGVRLQTEQDLTV